MKAAVVTTAGAVPDYRDFPDPERGEGQQLVELVASAIHPVVRARASAEHYSSTGQFPLVPGVDAVARTADGGLVYTGDVDAPWGTFAQQIAVTVALPLPEGADPVAVAAGMNPGMASWMPLTTHADQHGTPATLVVLGATGAAGGLAVQNARALGVPRVIGLGRGTNDLERVAGLGAETIELAGDHDTDAAAIGAALHGSAPDLVLDFVWGEVAEAAFAALAEIPAGATSYVQIGSAAGEHAAVPASLLRSRPFRLSGSGLGSVDMRRYLAQAGAYTRLITDGTVHIDAQTYPLSQVSQAWTAPAGPRPVLIAD